MRRSHPIAFKIATLALIVVSVETYGQKQTKVYKEKFNVGNESVLELNTSYADIEFETWDKNEVQIDAIVEIEGISSEEAENYFKANPIKIVGNSTNIEVSTQGGFSWISGGHPTNMEDFHIEIPEIPEMDFFFGAPPIPELPEFPEMAPMPPIPPVAAKSFEFDYEAYEKDGEKYLKKWKKDFDKDFNEGFKKEMEAWSNEMKARSQEIKLRRDQMGEEHKRAMEDRQEAMKDRQEAMVEHQIKIQKKLENKVKNQVGKQIIIERESSSDSDTPNIFYWSSDGKESNLKVKKSIRIKMPKSTKLKMNVRHGEVKLAENTKNIDATLSYATLLASTIDGDKTHIVSLYSPVTVLQWNYGQLKADYSEKVDLRQVRNLILNATSSEVTIDQLLKSIVARNDFGALHVNSVSKDFTNIDISLQNAELDFALPQTPFEISYTGTASEFNPSQKLQLYKTQKGNNVAYKGKHLGGNNGKWVTLNAKYSEVNLEL